MRGSIVKRGKGYSVVVELDRDPDTGKRRQRWHSGYRTRRDAERALSELSSSVHTGSYVPKSRATVADLAAEWLDAIRPTIRPSTHASYSRNLRLHVLPHIGGLLTTRVDGGTLNAVYAALAADGKRAPSYGGGAGLSPRTVRYVHTIVHRMFRDAVRWGRLARNPSDAADPPKVSASSHPEMSVWSAVELRRFLDGVADDRLAAAYVALATTGMRRGEALGLRWQDVDLGAGRVAIRQTVINVGNTATIGAPKTAKGRRVVTLDAGTVTALREHRKRQAAERLAMAAGFADHGLVFCRPDGGLLHPERFSRQFCRLGRRLGLPAIRLHDLRHGWATMALAAGVHPKVVQERLGHASIGITLDTYSHVTAGLHSDAAEQVAGLIFRRPLANG